MQAGVGLATVDRVLHGRGGVRAQTAQRIRQAMAELDQQSVQATLARRRFVIDVVMDTPDRFSSAVRMAMQAELAALPAAFRVRYHLAELAVATDLVATLRRIGQRGSHGVILKAPDLPGIADAVRALAARAIPTVTLVTDIPSAPRVAYVGLDNRAAGATAAYLIAAWMGGGGKVLVTLSSQRFLGEEQRESGFAEALRTLAPALGLAVLGEGRGLDRTTGSLVRALLEAEPEIAAVYSIGGGNTAVRQAFDALGRTCRVFVGHDLDRDNRMLLRSGRLHAVLHHDLRQDMRVACQAILQAQRVLPRTPPPPLSAAWIITPFNLPPEP